MSAHTEFIDVDGTPTSVQTFGCRLEDLAQHPGKHVLVCIPGNPGITGFYAPFLATLHARTRIPCCVLSHAGHEPAPRSKRSPRSPPASCTLAAQTQHKAAFLQRYIPSDMRVTLIGHSIGAKMLLDLLKMPSVSHRVDAGFLLFPTIERMSSTPNGKFFVGRVKPFVFLIVLAAWLFAVLPGFLKKLLVTLWLMFDGCSTEMADVAVRLVRPGVLKNVFSMAGEEMEQVVEPDVDTLRANAGRLVLYYGATDGWAPVGYATGMKEKVPGLDVRVCGQGFDHAFVLDASVAVGEMVAGWVLDGHKAQGSNQPGWKI